MRKIITQRTFYNISALYKSIQNSLFLSKNLCQLHHSMGEKVVEKSIIEKLQAGLNPIHLKVVNESYMHNVPKGSETHFKVFIVSKDFENKSLLNCHRLVNSLLEYELKNGVHALSIEAKTPSQWDPNDEVKPSPKCLGGFGK